MLYRSTDCLCLRGPPMKNLAHSASFQSFDKDAPSKPGTKRLVPAVRQAELDPSKTSAAAVQKDLINILLANLIREQNSKDFLLRPPRLFGTSGGKETTSVDPDLDSTILFQPLGCCVARNR